MRRRIEKQVLSQGILGALGSSKSSDQGILPGEEGDGTGEGIYNNIEKLSSSGGTLTGRGSGAGDGVGTGSGRGVRGGRRTEGEGIDAYVSDIGGGGSSSLRFRKISDFVSTELAPLDANGQEIQKSSLSSGARDIDEVAAIVYSKSRDVRNCYERVLRVNPDLKGKVVVRFTITPAGDVINPEILSSTLKNESVERCILTRIKTWDGFGEIDQGLGNSIFRQVYTFGF
ncbi:energy transducer TonB [candidate division KSB1 bacterium]|nr:energy transducer TonB [candidate division KSB1 bacterium]